MDRLYVSCAGILFILLFSCVPQPPERRVFISTAVNHPDWGAYYDSAGLNGSFILYSPQEGVWHQVYKGCSQTAEIPASTFKIPNALIALESGSVSNEKEIIKWDGVKRRVPAWNADTDMRTAMKNSTVWFFQELARRTGTAKMKKYLDSLRYGNGDLSAGIDQFWLRGNFKISPVSQIRFLEKLYYEQLPFSAKNQKIVKDIIVLERSGNATLSGKTGWGSNKKGDVGWFVGYVEKKDKVYFFSNCVFSADTTNQNFVAARKEISMKILREAGILE